MAHFNFTISQNAKRGHAGFYIDCHRMTVPEIILLQKKALTVHKYCQALQASHMERINRQTSRVLSYGSECGGLPQETLPMHSMQSSCRFPSWKTQCHSL